MMSAPELCPVPCGRCGAAMEAAGTMLRCAYCGASEPLPRDLAARLELLRKRVDQLRAEKLALDQLDPRVCGMAENQVWLRGTLKAALGPLSIITVVLLLNVYAGDRRAATLGPMFGYAIQLLSIVGGMVIAFLWLLRYYRRVLRPQILARVPPAPGLPARCRVCGGSLNAGDGIVECQWCRFTNFVGDDLARRRDELLAREVEEYRERQAGAKVVIGHHHHRVRNAILVGHIIGMALGFALGRLV